MTYSNIDAFVEFCTTYTNITKRMYTKEIIDLSKNRMVITEMPYLEKLFGGYPIEHIKELIFVHGHLSEENFKKIKKVDSLEFSSTRVPNHMSFADVVLNEKNYESHNKASSLCTLRFNFSNIVSITNLKPSPGVNILISHSKDFNNIHSVDRVFDLAIIDCPLFLSLQQCNIASVCEANFTNLQNFDNCNTIFEELRVKCSNLDSFRNIENINILQRFHLYDLTKTKIDNIINILNCTAEKITFGSYLDFDDKSFSICIEVLKKYVDKNNRHEYIMDCVLELLEINFESAAEL